MKDQATLGIASLLSVLSPSLQWADDVVREISPGWASGSVGNSSSSAGCTDRCCSPSCNRGYIIMLLASNFGLGAPLSMSRAV
jgi:hypothetical protein